MDKAIPSFYTLSLLGDTTEEKVLFEEYAEDILETILDYIYISIMKEIRHEELIRINGKKLQRINRRFVSECSNNELNVKRAYLLFEHFKWRSPAYGGKAWGRIARAWLEAHKMKGKVKNFPKAEYFRRIDLMIQLSHNTGNVLTKVFTDPQAWLDKKYSEKNPQWVVNQALTKLKLAARRLVKERYGCTLQEISEEGPFLRFRD